MLRAAFGRLSASASAFAPPLQQRLTSLLGGVRTKFSVDIDGRPSPDLAMSLLNRKLQRAGVMRKLRKRGFQKPSKIKYDDRLKREYKFSYRKVQNVLTWIEIERGLSAARRKAARAEKAQLKGLPKGD